MIPSDTSPDHYAENPDDDAPQCAKGPLHQNPANPFAEGAITPFDEKPGEASVFPSFVGLVIGSVEIGLTKKRRLLREYPGLSDNTNMYSGKDASMHNRNLYSLFWQV